MTPQLDLSAVKELMLAYDNHRAVFAAQHPSKALTHRYGSEICAASIVLMSSLLQSHIEKIFEIRFKEKFMHIINDHDMKKIWDSIGISGNPSPPNIDRLFLRLGIIELTADYLYCSDPKTDRLRLTHFNAIRNKISHGQIKYNYVFDEREYKLTKSQMWPWIGEIQLFGDGLLAHVKARQL